MESGQFENNEVPEIKFNIDEFDLENYEFKPLNKGLGFHHSQKEAKEASKVLRKERPKVSTPIRKPLVSKQPETLRPLPTTAIDSNSAKISEKNFQSGLELFYENESKAPAKEVELPKETKTINMTKAGMMSSFAAWLVDVMIICTVSLITFSAFALIAGAPFELKAFLKFGRTFLPALLVMFSLFFLLYFSVLELGQTFGAQVFGIKVLDQKNKSIGIKKTLLRSFISLISIPLVGFPILMDFHGKLTDTENWNA